MLRIEPRFESLESARNERPILREVDARVIAFRFKETDLAHAHEPAAFAVFEENLVVFVEQALAAGVVSAAVVVGLQACEGFGEARGIDRFEQVIERAEVEGFERVLIVGGGEDDAWGVG